MQTRRDVFQAIADPTRREIISLLSYQQLNLNSLANNFAISRPAISQQIKILVDCGLVQVTQQGRERYCEAKLEELSEIANWIEPFHRHWTKRFDLTLEESKGDKKKGKKKKQSKKKKDKNK